MRKKLHYEMGDADVVDRYSFTLTVGKDLKVHYAGAGSEKGSGVVSRQ